MVAKLITVFVLASLQENNVIILTFVDGTYVALPIINSIVFDFASIETTIRYTTVDTAITQIRPDRLSKALHMMTGMRSTRKIKSKRVALAVCLISDPE